MLDCTRLRSLPALFAAISLIAASMGGALVIAGSYATTSGEHAPRTASSSYQALHEVGVTGQNVSVGIIESTGFDVNRLGDGVAAARAFGNGKTIVNGGANEHGTAVARTVAQIAPDSTRYVAAFGDERDFRTAVDWMDAQDVDVVVIPAAFYGKPGDGTAWSARAVQKLARDTVVVAAAGNVGDGSWQGAIDPAHGPEIRPRHRDSGQQITLEVTEARTLLWASWSNPQARYAIRLEQNGTTVASSEPYPSDAVPNELIDSRLPPGTYEVIVEPRDGEVKTTETLRLQTPAGELRPHQARGSLVAPATARGIIVVGAYDSTTGQVPSYSARGPTLDGRSGVDVVASASPMTDISGGDDAGTSYAAARTAGIAALVLAVDSSLTPGGVQRTLESTARDVGIPGPDAASGHGLVQAGSAVTAVRRSP